MKHYTLIISLFLVLTGISCKQKNNTVEDEKVEGRVPVTITNATVGEMSEVTVLNATSSFLMKTFIKATTNGYLQEVNIKLGDEVVKGQKLFAIRTKESENLGNTLSQLDSSLSFSGLSQIFAPANGYITQLTYISGNYVQDGETLAAISDMNSLVFLLDMPYELKSSLPNNKTIELMLPDGQKINGSIVSSLSMVDPVSQTLACIIKVSGSKSIPENLIAKVNLIKEIKQNAISLPKEAVLTNEVQSEFWVMKMTDSITAVKVPIVKGMETSDRIEIISPVISTSDKILLTGNLWIT
jgi:multidrug efflux pump subunit AcrA (membrane-fusion protein)